MEKPQYEPIAAYNYRRECRILADLELIRNNQDELHMESLAIRCVYRVVRNSWTNYSISTHRRLLRVFRERILGQRNPDMLHSVIFRGAVFADHSKFERCIALWLHAVYVSQLNKISVTKDLLRFAQVSK